MLLPEHDTLHVGLTKIASEHAVPDFVKAADAASIYDHTDELPLEVFADPINRSYPLHTKVATWVSNGYFLDNYAEIPEEKRELMQERISKAAAYFGIEDEIERQTYEKMASIKVANYVRELPDSCYMDVSYENGVQHKRGIIRTPEQLNKAANWIKANRNELPLEKCTEYADRVLARADELNVKVANSEYLERLLGLGTNDSEDISRAIKVRADLVKDASLRDYANKLAVSVKKKAIAPLSEMMYKVATAIDNLDRAADLISLRKQGKLEMPEDICFNHSIGELTKLASETVHLTSGDVFSLEKIASLSRIDFESAMGSELADACYDDNDFNAKQASAVLASLPRPNAEQLTSMLKEHGIEPDLQTKAASAVAMPAVLYDLFG